MSARFRKLDGWFLNLVISNPAAIEYARLRRESAAVSPALLAFATKHSFERSRMMGFFGAPSEVSVGGAEALVNCLVQVYLGFCVKLNPRFVLVARNGECGLSGVHVEWPRCSRSRRNFLPWLRRAGFPLQHVAVTVDAGGRRARPGGGRHVLRRARAVLSSLPPAVSAALLVGVPWWANPVFSRFRFKGSVWSDAIEFRLLKFQGKPLGDRLDDLTVGVGRSIPVPTPTEVRGFLCHENPTIRAWAFEHALRWV